MASKKNIAEYQHDKIQEEKKKKKGILPNIDVDIIPMSYSRITDSVEEI